MPSEYQTKTCHVTKDPSESYEFFLKNSSERKGQIITSVGSNGPAERAGLKDGDRIVEINGKNVENKEHDHIVELIKESMPKNEITLEVVEESLDPNAPKTRTNGSAKGKEGKTPLVPRLILLKKKNNTYGFQLENRGKDKPGHFVIDITEGGAAQTAGLKENDRIIEINGDRVEKLNHKKVVGLMMQSGNQVKLLVVDEATYKHFTARKIKIKAKHASTSDKEVQNKAAKSLTKQSKKQEKSSVKLSSVATSSDDANARLVHVVKSSNSGFGFFLRMRKDEKGEFLGNVEPGKPSGRCGLMENDLILSVNKKAILSKSHDDVIEIIKSNSNHAVFLVIGPRAKENAKNNGLLSTLDGVKEHVLEKPRQVKLDKGDDGYGFYLKLQKLKAPLHIVTDIAEDSPAAREGLQEGEVVGRVGNNDVMSMGHDECVQKIKEAGNSVELTVGSAKTFEVLYDLKVPINDDLLNNWPDKDMLTAPDLSEHDGFFKLVALSKAADAVTETVAEKVVEKKTSEDENLVLCNLKKINGAFGFFLRDNDGHFLGTIEEGGSADVAGVKDNDEIVEVNGVNVEKVSHDEVVNRIASSGDEVSFLVRRKLADQSNTTPVDSSAVVEQQVEEKKDLLPRLCELNRLSSGYGFHLNSTTEGERQGEYLTKIASDGAASIAGVREGDRVIEVNDESISSKTHDEVVGLIRQYPDKVTVLVVDEEADRFYKEKGIAITKALLVAAAISERKEDSRSHTSSTIEAEATVHVDADQISEKDKHATIEFPPPPADEDKTVDDEEKEEQILEELREIAEEINEVAAEEMANDDANTVADKIADNIADEIADEIAENVADKIADDVADEITENVADRIADDVAEEIAENVADKIADDVAGEIAEKITEDLPENLSEEVREEIKEEIQENIADEIREDIKEEIEDDVKEAVVQSIEDDVREAVHDEIKEEVLDVVENEVRDNLKAAAAVVVANEILEAAKEESEAEEETKEETKETMEEYKARLEREMREQIEREMKKKLEDEMKERMENEMKERMENEMKERMENEMKSKMAAEASTSVPEPPPVVGVAAMAKAFNQNSKPKSPVKKASPFKFVPQADSSFKIEDIAAASKRLKSIKKVNEVQNKVDKNNPDEEQTQFKPSFMSAKSMFEGGMKQQSTKQRPAWQQNRNTSVKQDPPKNTISQPPAQAKPQTGRQNPWKTSGMSFKIVETSSGFN